MPKPRDILNESIAAVFVTMNRAATALTCLQRLSSQTLPPSKVFVFDNASSDDTCLLIEAFQKSHPKLLIDLTRHTENIGNAGGMEIVIAKVFEAGFQHIWILDDDSWPEPEALEKLLSAKLHVHDVRSCKVLDTTTGKLSWPLQVKDNERWSLLEGADHLPGGPVLEVRRSWLGALLPRDVYKSVGPMDGRLFLRGEDEDYPRRIEKQGFRTFMIKDSVLHHPPSGRLNRWNFPGITIVMESGLRGDKLYYRLRNSWWIIKREYGAPVAFLMSIVHLIALLCWERPVSSWFSEWKQASRDAFAGRLGKRKRIQLVK